VPLPVLIDELRTPIGSARRWATSARRLGATGSSRVTIAPACIERRMRKDYRVTICNRGPDVRQGIE
jgi:hypothetical protein